MIFRLSVSPYSRQPPRNLLVLVALVILGCLYEGRMVYNERASRIPAPLRASYTTWFRPTSPFWKSFAPILASTRPRCGPPPVLQKAIASRYSPHDSWKEDIESHLSMTDVDVRAMKRSHDLFVDVIKFGHPKLDYTTGTRGIVTSAGGEYFPPLVISLQMLRRTNSTLPVEVFLNDESEYEAELCEVILPSLNAKCLLLSHFFKSSKHDFAVKKYQLKIFAMLFSSFEEILFLDADSFPIRKPEELFEAQVYRDNGMVLWPDLWSSTVSPQFLEITGIAGVEIKKRPTIESGQLLVSKSRHTKTLLLSAYYNTFGEWYYHLMTQGGPGEGDKATFAPAALVLNATFHTVQGSTQETVDWAPKKLGNGPGFALLQYNPTPSCTSTKMQSRHPETNITTTSAETHCSPEPLFIHASWPPKLNALRNHQNSRLWGSERDNKALIGMDVEMVARGLMCEMACFEDWEFSDWGRGNKTEAKVCKVASASFRRMFGRKYEREDARQVVASSGELRVR